jgi:hypothetical protein
MLGLWLNPEDIPSGRKDHLGLAIPARFPCTSGVGAELRGDIARVAPDPRTQVDPYARTWVATLR